MILALVWAAETFLLIPAHQPHKDFMQHLFQLKVDNPNWAEDTKIDKLEWKGIRDILKAMWRLHNEKDKTHKKFKEYVSLGKTLYNRYLQFMIFVLCFISFLLRFLCVYHFV